MFKKGLVALFSTLIISCVHTEHELNSQFFQAPREKVWEVLVAVLKSYPLKTIDERKGYIETEVLGTDHFWVAPHQKNQDFSGYSSVIIVRLDYQKPMARVFIDKKVYKQKGFISSKEEIPSDFLEETILFYRVNRELNLQSQLGPLQ